jgi:hypothetical protein
MLMASAGCYIIASSWLEEVRIRAGVRSALFKKTQGALNAFQGLGCLVTNRDRLDASRG